ncbi:MAG TPA: hypothetical protein VGH11_13500 [Jatrophihabitans sp.]
MTSTTTSPQLPEDVRTFLDYVPRMTDADILGEAKRLSDSYRAPNPPAAEVLPAAEPAPAVVAPAAEPAESDPADVVEDQGEAAEVQPADRSADGFTPGV